MFGMYLPIMERMLRAGYAVFSWDKPGTGESTGSQRQPSAASAGADRPGCDRGHEGAPRHRPGQIGLWGVSQAGYVMPLVLSQSEDIAFMICRFLWRHVRCRPIGIPDRLSRLCGGVPEEKDDQLKESALRA